MEYAETVYFAEELIKEGLEEVDTDLLTKLHSMISAELKERGLDE